MKKQILRTAWAMTAFFARVEARAQESVFLEIKPVDVTRHYENRKEAVHLLNGEICDYYARQNWKQRLFGPRLRHINYDNDTIDAVDQGGFEQVRHRITGKEERDPIWKDTVIDLDGIERVAEQAKMIEMMKVDSILARATDQRYPRMKGIEISDGNGVKNYFLFVRAPAIFTADAPIPVEVKWKE